MKIGANIVVVGRQGAGKTPWIKKLMKGLKYPNNVVFDYRGEYDSNITVFRNFKAMLHYLPTLKGSFIVIEEATAFINSFKSMQLTDLMIGIQHNRNVCVWVFHALDDVPPYVLRLSQYIYLFPTNDDGEKLKQQRPAFYPYYLKAMKTKKPVLIDNYK